MYMNYSGNNKFIRENGFVYFIHIYVYIHIHHIHNLKSIYKEYFQFLLGGG